MHALGVVLLLLSAALMVGATAPAGAELRINDLEVFLNDHDVTVDVVLLGAVPPTFTEALQSGLPTHVRITVELWQYNRLWRDQLLITRVVERTLDYNVVSKEYKVASVRGENRRPYLSRELREAQRVLSELRGVKLVPAASLDSSAVIYVRIHAESALSGENTFITRMAGTAEQVSRQSDYRTISRAQ
jgi:hypothetical protein